MIDPEDSAEDTDRTRLHRRASLGWAGAGVAVFVALVIAGWGFSSLTMDRDVIEPGLPLWAGPTAVAVSAVVVFVAAGRAVRGRWARGRGLEFVSAITAGVGAALAQGAVIAVFAAFGGEMQSVGSALLGAGFGHVASVFGLVVVAAGTLTVLALEALAGHSPPRADDD